ncbi:MAG: ribosomal RNA small subunit methyltransferase A [Litorilinea sp.]|nr:MAG: ribosomal RNA small subunit methyltransferase A [Litorilinea sp.]
MTGVAQLIRRYDLSPKRSLGQNFLVDETHLDRIAAAAELSPQDVVLEVGPGLGGLTRRLAQQAGRVVAVELDDRLIQVLREELAPFPHVQIVHGDILTLDPATLVAGADALGAIPTAGSLTWATYKVVANLPYYITSAVLRHLLEARLRPSLAVLMVQKEVAERICAQPGQMSLLAVSVQFYARPQMVHRVPAGAFYPRPKVDSAVLRLEVFPEPAVQDVAPERFFAVVRAGFSQKRKQLLNSLSAGLHWPKPQLQRLLEGAGIDPRRRPETLSLDEWRAICLALDEDPQAPPLA